MILLHMYVLKYAHLHHVAGACAPTTSICSRRTKTRVPKRYALYTILWLPSRDPPSVSA